MKHTGYTKKEKPILEQLILTIAYISFQRKYNRTTYSNDYKVRIAVIDSGNINNFSNVVDQFNAIENSNNVTDNIGHGTAIIYKLNELYPNAEIIPIKITNNAENILPVNLAKGIIKAIEFNVDIISLSVGTTIDHNDIHEAIQQAIKKKIIIVSSAGNNKKQQLN